MLRTKIAAFVTGLALMFAALPALAQVGVTGSISGTVVDEASGQPVAGVTVQATGPQGDEATITDEAGGYRLSGLPIGTYVIRFFMANSNVRVEQQNVIVSVDKTVRVNARMKAASQQEETYTITERAPAIDTASTRVGTTMTKEFTENVPTSRDFGGTLQKAPGAYNDAVGVSLGGATGAENNYIMDGVNITSIGYGQLGSNLSTDFVQETEVITGGYTAEYGRALGGVVNVVTESGTNEFHGSVFAFFSPTFLSADPKIAYNRSTSLVGRTLADNSFNLGLRLGGPIIKNKLFFHVGYSPTFTRNKFQRVAVALSDKDNDGIVDGVDGNGDGMPDKPDSNGDGVPDTVVPVDTSAGQLFSDDIKMRTNAHQVNTKLTFIPAENHSLQAAYYGNFSTYEGPRAANMDLRASQTKDVTNSNDVSLRWVSKLFDRAMQVEASLALHHEKDSNESPQADMNALNAVIWQTNPSLSQFDMRAASAGACADRAAVPADPMMMKPAVPAFRPCPVQNYQSGGYDLLQDTSAQRIQADLKNTHHFRAGGKHELKYGLNYELNSFDDSRGYSGVNGSRARSYLLATPDGFGAGKGYFAYSRNHFSYPKGRRAYEFTDFGSMADPEDPDPDMNGKLSDIAGPDFYQDFIAPKTETNNIGYFIQDGYELLPNLRLNVGFRWEYSKINDFDGSEAIALGGNPMDFSDMFAPRLGLIYDPTNEGKAKLYASYGRFYESIPMDINNRVFGNEGLMFTFYDDPEQCMSPLDEWGSGDAQKGWKTCDVSKLPVSADYFSPSGGENALVQKDLKGQYSDEIILGGQYELFEDFTFGASYINRRLGRIVEDASGDGAHTYVISNPGDIPQSLIDDLKKDAEAAEAAAMADPSPANRAAASEAAAVYENLAVIKTFPKAKRDYNAMQLTASKRFSKSWLMQASYTYARTLGNYTGLFAADNGQLDPNITSQYDLAELLLNRDGALPNDRPHVARLDGAYVIPVGPGGLTLGMSFVARSGAPLNYQGRHVVYGRRETFVLPRGAGGRTPMITQLDAKLGWRQQLSGGMTLDAFVDVFNVLNQDERLSQDSEYTVQRVNAIVDGTEADLKYLKQTNNAPVTVNPNYKNASSFQAPLAGRFGLRLSF